MILQMQGEAKYTYSDHPIIVITWVLEEMHVQVSICRDITHVS